MHARALTVLGLIPFVVAACGSDSGNKHMGDPDEDAGGDGGSRGDGGGDPGGGKSLGGSPVGDGGFFGSGGKVAAGGAATGGVGTGGTPSDCEAPPPGQTSLCITVSPEPITAQRTPRADKQGVLVAQVFATPTPPRQLEEQLSLATFVLPADATSDTPLDSLPPIRLVGAFPATAYVRVVFADDPALLGPSGDGLAAGAWIGGLDLSGGLIENPRLLPVRLAQGAGNTVDVPLLAFRRLSVTVTSTADRIGDGQGPLDVIVMTEASPGPGTKIMGLAQGRCVDIAGGSVTVEGVVIGAGPYWLAGVLNDLGLRGERPPGSLSSLSPEGSVPVLLDIPQGAYSVSGALDLGYVVPLDGDAGAPPLNSCRDLVGGADAGTDGG